MDAIYLNNENRNVYMAKAKPSAVAIGFFDGMHKGHQQVLTEAKRIAKEKQISFACMSFFPHPKEVLASDKEFQYLMPMEEKMNKLREIGVDTFYIVEFDAAFASLSPKQFIKKYLLDLNVKDVVAGFDFTYGHRGEGNMDRIEKDSGNRLQSLKVNKVEFNGDKISSSLIRKMIRQGQMEMLHHYLGSDYKTEGQIVYNNYFAEIKVLPHYLLPPSGMYVAEISKGSQTWRQQTIVQNGRLLLPEWNDESIERFSYVNISWLKCLSSGLLSHLRQSV